jgi:type IV secretory pathway VirJ component
MKLLILLLMTMLGFRGTMTANTLPVTEWASVKDAPLVLYISGDGGLNDFSTSFCDGYHQAGYNVSALNAKSYFWNKKKPEDVAAEINSYVQGKFSGKTQKRWTLIGYSFGADVLPFIINRLPDSTRSALTGAVMISPSTSTDFEIHWSDMLGFGKKRGMDVVAEINRMPGVKTVTVFGDDEKDFPISKITIKNYTNRVLAGGHHFDGDTAQLVRAIIALVK